MLFVVETLRHPTQIDALPVAKPRCIPDRYTPSLTA
jgi:hypothetical protein